MRIEDLDPPREVPGSADRIIADLAALGFEWNESIFRQSTRTQAYQAALERLIAAGRAYPCSCSRSEIRSLAPVARASVEDLYYPGWCRDGVRAPGRAHAMRVRVPDGQIHFTDSIQGEQRVDVATETGDFIVRRRDGLFAYQLAVVIDDADQRITDVVRGTDLLKSTARQIALHHALGFAIPEYAHVPVATDANGIKLSKSAGAAAIDTQEPTRELWRALDFLKQEPPPELQRARVTTLWEWAMEYWRVQPLRCVHQVAAADPL